MTPRTQQIYQFVRDFITREGYSPSQREIADGCGYSGTPTVGYHLSQLEGHGLITRQPGRHRSIQLCEAPRGVAEGHQEAP